MRLPRAPAWRLMRDNRLVWPGFSILTYRERYGRCAAALLLFRLIARLPIAIPRGLFDAERDGGSGPQTADAAGAMPARVWT